VASIGDFDVRQCGGNFHLPSVVTAAAAIYTQVAIIRCFDDRAGKKADA